MTLQLGRHSYGNIEIRTWTQRDVIVRTGAYCSFGGNIRMIIDGNHRMDTFSTYPFHRLYPEIRPNNYGKHIPCIGNDVWIGSDVTIYSGIDIGDGAVIAGQSVVTKTVPPYAIVAGNPTKIVKYRFDPETINTLLEVKWWELPDDFIRRQLIPVSDDIQKVIDIARKYRGL